jgi:hypothetical protein
MSGNEALKAAISEYTKVHKQLFDAMKEINFVKRQKAELGEVILSFLEQNNVNQIHDKDGNVDLIRKESTRTEGIKKDMIMKALRDAGVDAEKIMNDIENQRTKNTKAVLKYKKSKS